MAKSTKSSRKSSRLVLSVVVILALALVLGLILKFTNIGSKAKSVASDLINPQFRVECNGVAYTGADNTLNLADFKGKLKFDVKCTDGYKPLVAPNVTEETDFTYSVGGHEYSFGGEGLTGYIVANSDIYGECFYIDCNKSYSLSAVLGRIWGGADITFNAHIEYPYKLTVISDDGEEICILLAFDLPIDVTVSPENIEF